MSILIKTSKNQWDRRSVLRGMGVAAASSLLPVLEADAATGPIKRVCFITTPNGIAPEVIPTGTERDFQLGSAMQQLNSFKPYLTYLHGVDMKTYTTNRIPNDHPPVVNQLLTAADSVNPNDGSNPAVSKSWLSSGQSIDQFLADRLMANDETKTRYRSIVAGVDCASFAWKQVFSAPSQAIFPENNAANLHQRIFEGVNTGGEPDPELTKKLARRQSVIDSVRAELQAVQNKVSSADRQKIEAHLTSVLEIENRLNFDKDSVAGSTCSVPNSQNLSGTDEDKYRQTGENMMDVIAHAFACDQTRVATLQWGNGASNQKFPSIGINEAHHSLTHDNFSANAPKRAKISAWYGERLKYFMTKLESIREGDGTLLDSTLLVWTSEHNGAAQHGRNNIPFTLAGRLGGAITGGQFLNYSGNARAHNDVYVSIAQGMGFTDVTKFGKPSLSVGPLPGLLV